MGPKRICFLGFGVRMASRVGHRGRRMASLAAVLSVLLLVSLSSSCANPKLSYVFVDGDYEAYKLSLAVAEKGPNGETLGTVGLEALLRAHVNIDKNHRCACFVTIDYEDTELSTTASAWSSGNQIPRAYFHLCEDRLLTFADPASRGDGCSDELAKTGPNGSLGTMLLNTFVGKCFAQPIRDSRQELKIGNEWTTTRRLPGEFMTYLCNGQRPSKNQIWETTQVVVTGLAGEGESANLAWSSITPLQGSWQVDPTERLLELGMDPSEIAGLAPGEWEATMTMSGSCSCSGTTLVRMSDGWPQRASVERMTIDVISSWTYPEGLLLSEEIEPVEMILEITGSIEATS